MRTFLLIFGTVLLIVLVGGLYVWMQPAAPPAQQITVLQRLATQPAPPALAPTTSSEDESVIKASENAWFKVFDEKTARLLWRIRTARNDPQPDGSINVTEPEAEFFLDNGNRLTLHGKSGHVIVPGGAMKNPELRGPIGQPSRGELYDVTISVYPTWTALQSNLVCKVNNISFDNDTLRITTEPFKLPDGTVVPADEVPVQVRGDEMDFDGRGLTILWNARTRELQLLEIAHGESLVAKTGFSPGFSPTAPTPNTGARGAAPARRGTPTPARGGGRRSSVAPQRQVARGAPTTTTKPATTQPVYRAIFEKDVSVTQGDVLSAKADVMRVDYRMDSSSGALTSPTPPAPPMPSAAVQRGGTRRGARAGRGAPPPTTSTASAPGIVRWTGKLTILALDTEAQNLGPGEKNIEMSSQSTPVVLDYDGKELKCASFNFSQGDQSLIVRSSPQVPLISMAGADGSYVTTPSLRYTGDDDLAVLEGKSSATMLLGDPDAPEIATLNWTDSGMFTMNGKIGEQMSVQQADFSGDVVFTHPKFNLKSQTLQVVPAPTTAPSLEHMEAHGNVVCDMIQEKGSPQHITTDSLIVKTAPGPDGPQLRTVIADGSVHSFSDEKSQDLVAGSMEVTLGPTTRPGDTPPIEHIVALRQVVFSFVDSEKKTTGKCDTLDMGGDLQTDMDLKMSGQLASLTSDQTTLRGAIINIKSKEQTVSVIGPGILEGAQAMSEDSTPQNFKVTWNRSFDLSLLANHGEIRGDVVVLAVGNNGWNTTATGDTLAIELMDAPATQPATQASTQPTTAPGGFASMGAKTTKSITLDGNSVVTAIYTEQDPTPLRQVHLYAPAIRIDEPQDQKRMKMSVPSAGRMLYQTAQKPTTNPATNPTTMATTMATTMPSTSPAVAHAGLFGDMSGPTAFSWSKDLVFDPAIEQVQFNGAVIINHESTAGATYRLEADQVTAKIPSGRDASTATPTDFTFKRLDADGSVRFYAQRIAFDAGHMDYEADTQLLNAEGREGTPVRIYDAEGASAGSFDHVMFNTVTQDMQLRGIQGRVRN